MYEAAIEMNVRFLAEAPFGGFRAEVGGYGYPMKFVLISEGGPSMDKYWLGVQHLVGGPPQPRPPGVDWKPYAPPAVCLPNYEARFAKLRQRFEAKWLVKDGNPKGFNPYRSLLDTPESPAVPE